MRNGFSGFYGVSEDAIGTVFTSAKTIFIFDANIFLTLYRCEEETRNRFFEIWETIKGQCWFPHQVCLEYQRNRLKVVKDSRDALDKIPKKISGSIAELKTIIFDGEHNQTISRYSNLKGELNALFEQIESAANNFSENHIDARKKNIDFLTDHDVIRDRIDELTDGRIGPAPANQEVINKLNTSGKTRYKFKTGPGYDDSPAKDKSFYSFDGINYDAEYGDYYVWSQILEYVNEKPNCNVVYVTNDAKSDFYYKIEGKIRGPNESLRTEIKKHGVAEFLLQNIDTFLHHANEHLNAEIAESVISELTNASHTRDFYKPWLIIGKNKIFHANLNPDNISYDHLFPANDYYISQDHYLVFKALQNEIDMCEQELRTLESAPMDELNGAQTAEVNSQKNILKVKLNSLMKNQRIVANKISELKAAHSNEHFIPKNLLPPDE
jgi:hypothetical protein